MLQPDHQNFPAAIELARLTGYRLRPGVAASVYLVVVLEILKLRRFRLRQLAGLRGPAAPQPEEVDAGVARIATPAEEAWDGHWTLVHYRVGEDARDPRALRDLPGERVLAPAGAEKEDVHKGNFRGKKKEKEREL